CPIGSARIPSGTRSRLTFSKVAPTCASFRNCSDMRASVRRSSTRMSRESGSARCTPGRTRGPDEERTVTRYADNLLADGERVVLRTRQHWLATIVEGRMAWAIFIAAVVLEFLAGALSFEIARNIFRWFALAL